MRPRPLTTAAGLAASVLVLVLPGVAARAEPGRAAAPRDQARLLLAEVDAADAQLQFALASLTDADRTLAAATSARITRDSRARDAARASRQRSHARDDRVRALYMAGGPAAAYATALDSGDLTSVLDRFSLVRRVLADDDRAATGAAAASSAAVDEAGFAADAAVRAQGAQRAADEAATRLEQLVVDQQWRLAQARARAAELDRAQAEEARRATEAAAARLRVEQAAVGDVVRGHVSQLQADAGRIPEDYLALYQRAAARCPGLAWTVLAAVGRVESRHGVDTSTSTAGAQGPMQFLPSTWRLVGTDGDGDGRADIANPADAVATAAVYLCQNDAPADLHAALWAYNRAEWYVTLVLGIAERYRTEYPPS